MGDTGGDLHYEPLAYRDLWPAVDELLPPLARHDADQLGGARADPLLDAHLLLDTPFAPTGGDALDTTFTPAVELATGDGRGARVLYGSVGSDGDKLVLRFRMVDEAGQPDRSACKLCDGPVDLFHTHEHSVQGRFVLSGDCVVLEVGAVSHPAAPPPPPLPLLASQQPSGPPVPLMLTQASPPMPAPLPVSVPVLVPMPQTLALSSEPELAAKQEQTDVSDPDDPRPHVCGVCQKTFTSVRVLNKHLISHSGVRFPCDQCDKTFPRLDRLRRHQLTHAAARPYVCDTCQKGFNRREYLVQHQRVHSGDQPFQCDVCGMRFSLHSNFTMHKRVHAQQKRFTCQVCERGFNRLDHLEAHKLQHSGVKPMICEKCGLQFSAREKLTRHMLVHAEEKPFGCAVCQRRFRRKDKLDVHMCRHASAGLGLACDLCPRVLPRHELLRQHARQHSDPAKVQCPTCLKFFGGQARYEAHAQRHKPATGVDSARHTCPMCTKLFRRPAALRLHLQKAHDRALPSPARVMNSKPRSFQCHLCKRAFTRQQTLRAHVQRVHEPVEPAVKTAAEAVPAEEPSAVPALGGCEAQQELNQATYQLLAFPSYSF